jgi:DAK2 domain fusion protein YloV
MAIKALNSNDLVRMLLGGAAMLSLYVDELNDLNVFPVADGDTGTNMMKTLDGALSDVSREPPVNLKEMGLSLRKNVLLSARGNSGVILSQIFTGICEVLEKHETADVSVLKEAYLCGVNRSYQSVQNPTEGTMLTVFRESTEYAVKNTDLTSSVEDFYRLHLEEAKRSLKRTKDLLPALEEADVIDSGAAGYVCIAEGMNRALLGEDISYVPTKSENSSNPDINSFTRDSVLEHGYCTEFLLRLTNAKCDPDTFDLDEAVLDLKKLGGESIVAYKDDDLVKIHVHTFTPGEILTRMSRHGEFLTVKIENMSISHTQSEKKTNKTKAFCVVAVADGDGISALFGEMGADVIVSGGQTSNPSIEELVRAFRSCDGKDIIVLPNNKNVILAANQAAKLYTDASVHVIDTKNIAEGYSALAVITPAFKDVKSLVESAERAARNVISAEITAAVRSTVLNGTSVFEGDYMAISQGELKALAKTPEDAVVSMLDKSDLELCEIITLFVGKNVNRESRTDLTNKLKEKYKYFEITVYESGQDVYDYVIAVE